MRLAGLVLAVVMAALSEPGPASLRFWTTSVRTTRVRTACGCAAAAGLAAAAGAAVLAAAAGAAVLAAAATAAHPASAARAQLARSRDNLWCRKFRFLPAAAIISLSPDNRHLRRSVRG